MAAQSEAQKKKAKYFCENCGSEVAAKARFCPKCGRFFSSVRCPNCGKMGTVKDFKHGCPSCHYAMTDEEIYGTGTDGEDDDEIEQGNSGGKRSRRKPRLSRKSKNEIKKAFAVYNSKHPRKASGIWDDVPTWLMITSVIMLIVIIMVVFFRCQ